MPTLTVELPDKVYRAALSVEPDERVRLVSEAFNNAEPELTENDYAAIGEGLAQMKRGEGTPGHIVFARLREKYGFPRGDNPLASPKRVRCHT